VTHITVLPVDEDLTSESLLDGLRAGRPASWRRLIDLYEPLVRRWCRRDGLTEGDIDDAWHEVFLTLMDHVGGFERRKAGAFRCWLRTITRRKVIDMRRQAARSGTAAGSDDRLMCLAAVPSFDWSREDDIESVGVLYRRALELLRKDFAERTWRAFWGVVIEGRSPADVAADLGLTRNAVFQAKARVLNRLREEFEDFIGE
jgi:RNA polymerase sigma-70 factor (ECF subfamily)